MRTCVIDTGGGMRGIYAAGVLDTCMEQGIQFDVGIGISAGSANVASYIAGQKKRNYQFYTEYSGREEYMSFRNRIAKKSYVDLDYVYGTLSNSDGENPLNYDRFVKSPTEFLVIATNAQTGEAEYFDKKDMLKDDYNVLKASCAIPYVCKPYEVYGKPYYDGALSDPIPIEKAISLGCEKIVLILTKPESLIRTPEKDQKLASMIQEDYPLAAEKLRWRAAKYNEGVYQARRYAKEGKVLIISPDDTCGIDTLTKDIESMKCLYRKGLCDAEKIKDFVEN